MSIISKSLKFGSSRYPTLSAEITTCKSLKDEVSNAVKSMEGKPTEISISKVTYQWDCKSDRASKIMSIENPKKNAFYRFAAVILRLYPKLNCDLGLWAI
ncbi:hypothetical protein [Maize yellow stripe virus]|nr:hypothetical protein [Maize yellow stripe virus]